MPSLTPIISFDVQFVITGNPAIKLTVITSLTSLQKVSFVGYFSITQPDGITETGTYTSPDISWNGTTLTTLTKALRLGTDQLFQKGTYNIRLYADHPDYTPGTISREFEFTYNPVTQSITESLDIYTPLLKYTDDTVYTKGEYAITSQSSLWTATSTAGVIPNSTSAVFPLAIGGSYYDATYTVAYTKTVNYLHNTYSWLTVQQVLSYAKTAKAYAPQSMNTLLTYLNSLKTAKDANPCNNSLQALYENANTLYSHIRTKVCAENTVNLKGYFDEFYRLTHNYQTINYTNTNLAIAAYDFTTGCGGSSVAHQYYSMRAVVGETTFSVLALSGKTILAAVRSGLGKAITASVTTDPDYLQVVGNVITLPTGDAVYPITLISGGTVGELFTFTYI